VGKNAPAASRGTRKMGRFRSRSHTKMSSGARVEPKSIKSAYYSRFPNGARYRPQSARCSRPLRSRGARRDRSAIGIGQRDLLIRRRKHLSLDRRQPIHLRFKFLEFLFEMCLLQLNVSEGSCRPRYQAGPDNGRRSPPIVWSTVGQSRARADSRPRRASSSLSRARRAGPKSGESIRSSSN